MTAKMHDAVIEQLRRPATPELHAEIRDLWKKHSIAEDGRDLPGLISTLTEECVYEYVPSGMAWRGHDGARRFYTELLTAFPDVAFELLNIVIGPQGVFEEARVTGTHARDFLEWQATGRKHEFTVGIFFPWDPVERKFSGERVYMDLHAILGQPGARRP